MDKAAIFAEVMQKNALRKQAQMPLLDVRAEYEFCCSVAARTEYEAFCATKRADRDRIVAEVMADHRSRTLGSRIYMTQVVMQRFETLVEVQYGVVKPPFVPRHAITYAQDRK